jgi:molecular chaperone GrpE (heat shock protein)
MLTLGQAARETGLTKSAISKAIKNGRLSAPKGEQGQYQIDPAELFRVYPVTHQSNGEMKQQETHNKTSGLHGQIEVLRELLKQVEGERNDLRRRLDEETEERRTGAAEIRRLALLTDQRTKPEPPRTGLWQRLFGRK